MRLNEEQLQRLADALLVALTTTGGATLKAERSVVLDRLAGIIRTELGREEDLDREARKLLAAHLKNAPPGVDERKLLQMIKQRLAAEKGIPL